MPISLSSQAIIEKNKLTSTGAFIVLLKVTFDSTSVYLCRNNEDITWNGETWSAYYFQLGDINETKEGELPTVDLNIWDINRVLTPTLADYAGGVGTSVDIYIVNTALLSETDPLRHETFNISEVSIDSMNKITFRLSVANLATRRSPKNRFLKTHCRYKEFKGSHCGYSGSETECDRTFARCKELENQMRFGGFPGVGQTGIFQ